MFEFIAAIAIGVIVGVVASIIYNARKKHTAGNAKTIGKPEFKYNSWYGCVMIRKNSFTGLRTGQ